MKNGLYNSECFPTLEVTFQSRTPKLLFPGENKFMRHFFNNPMVKTTLALEPVG